MEIYGLGIVAACMFIGSFIGRLIGQLVGLNSDVGGVGFAMLLMIIMCNVLDSKGKKLDEGTEKGIKFLSAIYIPVVVAMSSIQDVKTAFSGGVIAIVAGVVVTIGALFLVPVISNLGKKA